MMISKLKGTLYWGLRIGPKESSYHARYNSTFCQAWRNGMRIHSQNEIRQAFAPFASICTLMERR